MADDINKKITIQVEAQTDDLKQSITDLNQTLEGLLQKQKQLADGGKENTKSFHDLGTQIKATQTALENYSKAIDGNVKTLTALNRSLAKNKDLLAAVSQQHEGLAKSQTSNSENVKALNNQMGALSSTIDDQGPKLTESKDAFDANKASVKALSSSFDQLKSVTGSFGPSLQDAAKSFGALKSGPDISAVTSSENKVAAIKKSVIKQVEDYAKKSAGKIATDALKFLNTSIKQQSQAKIAALEKDKGAELSNSSLTSAQKLAIEQKYKKLH